MDYKCGEIEFDVRNKFSIGFIRCEERSLNFLYLRFNRRVDIWEASNDLV